MTLNRSVIHPLMRPLSLGAAAGVLALLSACAGTGAADRTATPPAAPSGVVGAPSADASTAAPVCVSPGRHRLPRWCLGGPGPDAATQALARQGTGSADALTVYVLRQAWADSVDVVNLQVDDGAVVGTLPGSFVRLRLSPGEHELRLQRADAPGPLRVAGAAGAVKVVMLDGSAWHTPSRFTLEGARVAAPQALTERLARLPLVGDLDARAR